MFNFFKKNNHSEKEDKKKPRLADIEGNDLKVGDIVDCLRYDLGKCKLVELEGKYFYESLDTGDKISWLKMVDAATDLQKVKKIS